MTNLQTQSLLKTAQSLHKILKDPLSGKVLEIDVNASSFDNEKLLGRLIRSLEQFVNKEKDIIYVGFVGHYSSGKSSTLNSLLELDNTNHRRETGLNPTDTAITLITDPQNSNSMILMSREEKSVPVRASLIDNDLLKGLVIADTPGSGDPQIVNEMIQDFLPICDCILYFISSANPIDQADLPLLSQKSQKLPFIPVKYIITRTDEFIKDRQQPVSDTNIDQQKKDLFTGRLLSRINQIIKPEQASPDDLIFIDNNAPYHIDLLKHTLVNEIGHLDSDEMIRIHSYKLDYYSKNFKHIFDYFLKITDDQIRQSTGYERTASDNIQKFDRGAEINKEKLRLGWSKNENVFQTDFDYEISRLNGCSMDYAHTLEQERQVKELRTGLNERLEGTVQGYYGNLIAESNALYKSRLRDIKFNISENIKQMDSVESNLVLLFPTRIGFQLEKTAIDVDFSKVDDLLNGLLQKINDIIQGNKNLLRGLLNQLSLICNEPRLIKSLEEQYKTGAASIIDTFSQYFERIQMYQSTVLSRNNKETIEKLRIGTQLDELDDRFDEAYMETRTDEAILRIFPDTIAKRLAFTQQLAVHSRTAGDIRNKLNDIDRLRREENEPLGKGQMDVSDLISQLTQAKETNINKLYELRLDETLNAHHGAFIRFEDELEKKRKNRKWIIFKWTIVSGLITLGIYIILRYLNYLSASTMTASILAGISANLIGDLLGFVYSSLKNDTKKITANSTKEFLSIQRTFLYHQFDETFWDSLTAALTKDNLSQWHLAIMKSSYQVPILEAWQKLIGSGQILHNELVISIKQSNELIEKIKHYEKAFFNDFLPVFADTEYNAAIIEEITRQIKEVSIKPLFDLLENITKKLQGVKTEIIDVTTDATTFDENPPITEV